MVKPIDHYIRSFKAEENAIEVPDTRLLSFNSHNHYSVGSQTIGIRLYQFCWLDVLCESRSALAFMAKMSFLTNKISRCYLTQKIQSKHRFLRKLSKLLIRLIYCHIPFCFVLYCRDLLKDVCFLDSMRTTSFSS